MILLLFRVGALTAKRGRRKKRRGGEHEIRNE
jgi:hypothetical protein